MWGGGGAHGGEGGGVEGEGTWGGYFPYLCVVADIIVIMFYI